MMIEFEHIRGHGALGSRAAGFEELVSQLFMDGSLGDFPAGTKFERTGNPDGGREGRAHTPDGKVVVWQAKYLFSLDASAYGQVTESVRRILHTEPNVRTIYVVLPYDRPAGDHPDAVSALTRWHQKVADWKAEATKAGITVDFEYIGASEIASALTAQRHAGRLRYWFDDAVFTAEEISRAVDVAVANAGPRYTREHHVDTPIVGVLHAVARTPEFEQTLRLHLAALREATRYGWHTPSESDDFPTRMAAATAALDVVDAQMSDAIALARTPEPLPDVADAITSAAGAVYALDRHLHEHCLKGHNYFTGTAAGLYTAVTRLQEALAQLAALTSSPAWTAAQQRLLLLRGDAGTGKTHLLCDFARAHAARQAPVVLVHGNAFDRRDPLTQIVEQCRFDGSAGEFLDTLDAAAEAACDTAVILIDAVNESDDTAIWKNALAGLVTEVRSRKHVALVVSCRSQYFADLMPESVRSDAAVATHRGFADNARAAVDTYLEGFGIERPSFPLLEPEFTNPLLLKLVCTTLRARGETRLPREGISLTWLFDAYLEAVNATLSSSGRCDFDAADPLVAHAVQRLAGAIEVGEGSLPREEARAAVDTLLPGRTWSTSLFKGMLDEGVLLAVHRHDGERVALGYERLGDVAVAQRIVDRGVDDVRAEVEPLAHSWWAHAGLLSALAVAVPERHGVELVDLLELDPHEATGRAVESFYASLSWRTVASYTDRTLELAELLIYDDDEPGWQWLLRLATIPEHPLNARWLHTILGGMTLPQRDARWSIWTATYEGDEIATLIDWCWSGDAARSEPEVRALAAIVLAWLCSSPSRPVRDRATIAAVSALDGFGDAAADLVALVGGVDDPYVVERTLAIACGVASRTGDAGAVAVGEAVADWWPTANTTHLLTRDYARRCLRAAVAAGWTPPPGTTEALDPPYGSEWPLSTRTTEEIETLAGPPDYSYGSITVRDWDDFRVKTVRHAIRQFADVPAGAETKIAARVFDRVLDLGWTPERFGWFDRGRRWEPTRQMLVERIGKKYQWIALYEELGRLADNFDVGGQFDDDPRRCYDDPLDVDARDIDPTRLVRGLGLGSFTDTPPCWWVPMAAGFDDSDPDEWIRDMRGVPDPLELIVLTADRRDWLTLESHYRWSEPHPPDVAATRPPERTIHVGAQAYLAGTSDADALAAWCANNLWTADLPDAPELSGRLLTDHPSHRTWDAASGSVPYWHGTHPPCDLELTSAWYHSDRDRDCSDARDLAALPTRSVIEALRLARWQDFAWAVDGQVVCGDPSAESYGRPALVLDASCTAEFHGQHRLLLWQVVGEKQVIRPESHYVEDEELWWVEFRAFYISEGDVVRRVGSGARLLKRGPTVELLLDWPLRDLRAHSG